MIGYNDVVSIIRSSGTGKSREVARSHFAIFMLNPYGASLSFYNGLKCSVYSTSSS